jgi:hypothetical protein
MLNRNIAGVRKSQTTLNILRMPDMRENENIPPNRINHPPFLFWLEYPMNRQYPTKHNKNIMLNCEASNVMILMVFTSLFVFLREIVQEIPKQHYGDYGCYA